LLSRRQRGNDHQKSGVSGWKLVKKRLLQLARQLPAQAQALHHRFAADGLDHAVLADIVNLIDQRCQLTARRLNLRPLQPAAASGKAEL